MRAERDRLNLLIDSVADPIIVTDQEGEISLMNNPAERLFTVVRGSARMRSASCAPTTRTLRRSSRACCRPAGRRRGAARSPGRSEHGQAGAGRGPRRQDALRYRRADGHRHDPARSHRGHRARSVVRAVEARIRGARRASARSHRGTGNQNELLRRQALELEQASAAKSQFLANVSHELRTPLNAILGYAAMTLQGVSGELSAPQRRNLSRIDANARHLLTLINEILDITRIEAGRMPHPGGRVQSARAGAAK